MLLPLTTALVLPLSALASSLLLWALIPQLRRRLLDQPNARSSHRQPTPRGGGLAFVLVAATASAAALGSPTSPYASSPALATLALPLVALPLAVVGFLDDRHNLPAGVRYGVQVVTALALLKLSPVASALGSAVQSATLAPALIAWVLIGPALAVLLIAATAVINFTNFMDGLDGLVAGCMAVILTTAGLLLDGPSLAIWPLVGALLGFLLWNWSPAKVFMGDVGSTFLGAVFAGTVLQSSSWLDALGLLLVATPLLGDACLCVLRRLRAGQRVFQAHRLHLYQRLHQANWSHARVSGLYIAATGVLALALQLGHWPWVLSLAGLELLIGFWLDRCVAVPFAVASKHQSPQSA